MTNTSTVRDYDIVSVMDGLRSLLRPLVQPGETLIYRDAFRWKDDEGHVIPNHYEMYSIEYLAEEFGYEVIRDFQHVAIVRKKWS
jgi:hypothetical protein